MRNRTLGSLLALCLLTLLAAGCAKQQVKKDDTAGTTTTQAAPPAAPTPAPKETPVAPPVVPDQQALAGQDSAAAATSEQDAVAQALRPAYFDFDSFELTSAAREVLAANAAWLKKHGTVRVQVEGHCDERGSDEYNLALGEKRAKAAAAYLKSLGIDAGRLVTISYGEERPADPGHDEAAWAKNRRAAFVSAGK